jgi:hypothetical protein
VASDNELAESTEDMISLQPKEGAAMESANISIEGLLEQQADLLAKLTGFGVAITETVEDYTATMGRVLLNIESHMAVVAARTSSDAPTWFAPYCSIQYGHAAEGLADISKTGPIPIGGITAGGTIIDPDVNNGSQFPSPVEVADGGPEEDITMSIMVQKATLTDALAATLGILDNTELRKSAFASSLGSWAIHYPWNGLVFSAAVTGADLTEITITADFTNDPQLRYGSIAEGNGGTLYQGYGWGGAYGFPGYTPLMSEHYIENIPGAPPAVLADSKILLHDRATGDTHEIDVITATLTNKSTIKFDVQFPLSSIVSDITNFSLGEFSFACAKQGTAEVGCHDTSFGFTTFMAWNCFEKDSVGEWLPNPAFPTSNLDLRTVDYEGSSLFFNSKSVVDINSDGGNADHARDNFYQINVDEDTMVDRDLYKANQLQGVYSGILKDIASDSRAWVKQWEAIQKAIESASESSATYRGESSYNSKTDPVNPIERYLALVRSSYTGITMQVPVDTLQQGNALSGIKMTMVTGAMYRKTNPA